MEDDGQRQIGASERLQGVKIHETLCIASLENL